MYLCPLNMFSWVFFLGELRGNTEEIQAGLIGNQGL
jgi:hypothetical protein